MKIIDLDQRSPEWLSWRNDGIGASEMAQVLNESPFGNAHKLWEEKTGRRPREDLSNNKFVLKGQEDEPLALKAYEQLTGEIMIPLCAEHDLYPFLRASFDGIRATDYKKAVEIKCPGAKSHEMAINGQVPEYYRIQMHQQMLVGDLSEMDYFSYFKEWKDPSKRGVLINVKRSELLIDRIIREGTLFWDAVKADKPLYTDGWAQAAAYYLSIDAQLEDIKARHEEAKKQLITLANGKDMTGDGVSVSHTVKKGSIDYKAILTDRGLDLSEEELNKFRGAESQTITVRKVKNQAKTNEVVETSSDIAKASVKVEVTESEKSWAW